MYNRHVTFTSLSFRITLRLITQAGYKEEKIIVFLANYNKQNQVKPHTKLHNLHSHLRNTQQFT